MNYLVILKYNDYSKHSDGYQIGERDESTQRKVQLHLTTDLILSKKKHIGENDQPLN